MKNDLNHCKYNNSSLLYKEMDKSLMNIQLSKILINDILNYDENKNDDNKLKYLDLFDGEIIIMTNLNCLKNRNPKVKVNLGSDYFLETSLVNSIKVLDYKTSLIDKVINSNKFIDNLSNVIKKVDLNENIIDLGNNTFEIVEKIDEVKDDIKNTINKSQLYEINNSSNDISTKKEIKVGKFQGIGNDDIDLNSKLKNLKEKTLKNFSSKCTNDMIENFNNFMKFNSLKKEKDDSNENIKINKNNTENSISINKIIDVNTNADTYNITINKDSNIDKKINSDTSNLVDNKLQNRNDYIEVTNQNKNVNTISDLIIKEKPKMKKGKDKLNCLINNDSNNKSDHHNKNQYISNDKTKSLFMDDEDV